MNIALFLLGRVGRVAVQLLHLGADHILIAIDCQESSATCPVCQFPSSGVHSTYLRKIRDLPWRGTPVTLQWSVRRFFCRESSCPRRIFAERLPDLAARRGRTSVRFNQALVDLGLECGGEGGRRLGGKQGIVTSGDTILRRLRAQPRQAVNPSRCIGIDDFAFHKGHRYGTLIVDHESGRVIDLLPERSVESTAHWLKQHEQVEIVTRDRSSLYAAGISSGRPAATQVADRFHLCLNLRESLVKMLKRHQGQVVQAARAIAASAPPELPAPPLAAPAPDVAPSVVSDVASDVVSGVVSGVAPVALSVPRPLSKATQLVAQRRELRLKRYEKVVELLAQGLTFAQVSRQTGVSRWTIGRYLSAGEFVEQPSRRRVSASNKSISPYAASLKQMWDSGVHNAMELFRRIKSAGFGGSSDSVNRYVLPWREQGQSTLPLVRLSSNRLAWLLLKDNIVRTPEEQKLIEQLKQDCDSVRTAAALACEFGPTLSQGKSDGLLGWISRAQASAIAELKSFADGLMEDWAAVKAAAELPWSNGRAEGHVNRLKLIKRKMYGRAKFDLLRIRVLASGP